MFCAAKARRRAGVLAKPYDADERLTGIVLDGPLKRR
jgi:hypothetical protein